MPTTSLISLSFYCFFQVEDLAQVAADQQRVLEHCFAKGRIVISFQGINAHLTLPTEQKEHYIQFLKQRIPLDEKLCHCEMIDDHAFSHLLIKIKQQLVAYPHFVDLESRAESVDPQTWKKMMSERPKKSLLLDVRNQIEWDLGHFEGSISSQLSSFRHFSHFIDRICQLHASDTQIMMYCTGGIRCELFSSLLQKRGFDNLYQLRGGILSYWQHAGSVRWLGRLFVFDQRLAIDVDENNKQTGPCTSCGQGVAHPFNCANADCNFLFLRCEICYIAQKGCCGAKCAQAGRVRKISSRGNQRAFGKLKNEQLWSYGKKALKDSSSF